MFEWLIETSKVPGLTVNPVKLITASPSGRRSGTSMTSST
jgi:hypothetical protein